MIAVKKIVIEINDEEIELTLDDARDLSRVLRDIFREQEVSLKLEEYVNHRS